MSAAKLKKMSSEYVVPRHVCRIPSYITDLDRNSLDEQILRATATDNLEQLKEWGKTLEDSRKTADVKDPEGRGLLHIAASKGGIGMCNYLLEELEMAVDEKDNENCTPLLHASIKGHLDAVVYLIQKGADPCAIQRHNTTALHMATFAGQIEVMRYLLMKGVDVNTPSQLGTPLQQSNGKVDVVRVLLDHGANPNVFVDYHPTPLEMCLIKGSLESSKLLIEAGADPNGGSGPLACAAANEGIEYIKFLLEAGADPNIQNDAQDGLRPIEVAALNGNHRGVSILFPVTSPIPACLDWSFSGLMKYVHSAQFLTQIKGRKLESYLKAKSQGEDARESGEYFLATLHYGKALCIMPEDAVTFSKRSLCYARSGYYDNAVSDAQACKTLRPDWPETYLRCGVALTLLKAFDMAEESFLHGLELDPEHKELQWALKELAEEREIAGPNFVPGYVCTCA